MQVETMLAFRVWYDSGVGMGRGLPRMQYPITLHAWSIEEAIQLAARSPLWTGEIELIKESTLPG